MKKFVCSFLILIMILGCVPAWAASPTDIDIPALSSATDLPEADAGTGGLLIAPAPSAASPQSWDETVENFLAENNVDPNSVTLGYYNTVTGEEHYFRGDEQMTAASVNKVPLNMYYAERVYNGEISFDETRYGGLPYREVQELSVRFSNNDYTSMLINAIGTYPDYRKAICPYIGVDPEEKEFGFFTVNEFTARQIMYCLKLLHAEPDRYPGVMENMSLASPGEYFEQIITDYEVAQKYGWYVLDNHNFVNCVGIVETEEPILLAIFTDNCRMGKNILGEYCALMCYYTENDIAFRAAAAEAERIAAQEEAQRIAAEEAAKEAERLEAEALAEAEAQRAEAEKEKAEIQKAEEEEEMDIAENAIRVVACIISCAILAAALGLATRRKATGESAAKAGAARNIASAVLGIAAIGAIILTAATCIRGLEASPIIMDESSDPSQRAVEFMDRVLGGDASEAEKMLIGSGKLGLDAEPEDELGKMLYAALQESFSYEISGVCTENSVNASQNFTVTYLDIPSLTALQQDATNARLARYLEAAERADEVQAEDGSWLPEVAMKALVEVTSELLANAREHYTETELTVNMQYSGGEWKIIADDALFAILSGNTAY